MVQRWQVSTGGLYCTCIAAGLKEIGFSEHLTLFSESLDWSMTASDVKPYLKHIKALPDNTRDIKVRTGLEVDFFPERKKRSVHS